MWALLLPVAYLIGTFPGATIVTRASGVDIRTVGSGNPGASNVTRTLGWRRGMWVFVLDAAKGALAAGLGLAVDGRLAGYALGGAAMVGHVFPVWARLRGGKGVATGAGLFAVMTPVVSVGAIAMWYLLSRLTHKASVASLVTVTLLPVAVGLVYRDLAEAAAAAVLCGFVISRHTENIRRLVTHKENSL